jgi:hypothetical protein
MDRWRGRWVQRLVGAGLLCVALVQASDLGPGLGPATSLQARYLALQSQLNISPFRRPVHLASTESSQALSGEVYAVMDYPLQLVSQAFTDPVHWCDVLILHINTKYCRAQSRPSGSQLLVRIGKKDFQALAQASLVEFDYRVVTASNDYFDVALHAEKGPLGTSDYRIRLEAVALQGGKTFLHITYSYAFGLTGQLAMQAYLGTVGRNKVGFTQITPASGGQPEYIGGMRGVVERNTMRYYLALEAYLDNLAVPLAQQFEQRLQSWYSATEMYPRQLHEMDLDTYLDMKRREDVRQKTLP